MDSLVSSVNAAYTEVVGAQRIREYQKGKKSSLARQSEVEREHQLRVNPVSESVPQDLPPVRRYNSKGQIVEDDDDEKDTDITA